MSKKRALFLKTKHLGDSVILTSSIEGMPSDWVVDVLCFPESNQIYSHNPRVERIYNPPKRGSFFRYAQQYIALLLQMKRRRYDAVFQFSDDWRGGLISKFINSNTSVCGYSAKRPNLWHKLFTISVRRPPKGRHAAELDFDLLRRVGLTQYESAPSYRLHVDKTSQQKVGQWLADAHLASKSYILIHASSRWMFKTLTDQQWVQLIEKMESLGHRIVLSGSPSDLEYNRKIASRHTLIPENFSLQDSMWLIKQSKLLVSIDSLPIHIASAFQTPVVAIFGPSGEFEWAPRNVPHRIVEQSMRYRCRPCGLDGCGSSKISQCLVTLPLNRILMAVDELLSL